MKDKLTHNLGLKLLSVFFATVLWFLVVSVDDPITTRTYTQIPVELTNTDSIVKAGKVYEIEDQTDVCSVTVTAKRSVLDSLSRDNFKATADMARLDNNLVPIDVKATRYADRLENINLKNKNVRVIIENLLEKQFNISVATKGSLAEGYVVGNTSLDKNIVKVSGPESIVGMIAGAEVTVDLSGMSGNILTSEDIVLVDKDGEEVDDEDIVLSRDSVSISVEIWNSKEVPITFSYVGTPAEGFGVNGGNSCNPSVVRVAGNEIALSNVSSVSIPAELLNITGAVGDVETEVDIAKYIPSGMVVVGQDKIVTVHIGVTPLESKYVEVPTSNITAVNIPEGMSATVGGLGEIVAVQVKGLGAAYDNVDPATIIGTVDLSVIEPDPESEEITPDVYEIPVAFEFPDGIVPGENAIIAKVLLQVNGEHANGEDALEETDDDSESED